MRFLLLLTLGFFSPSIQSQTNTTLPASLDRAIVTPKRVERVFRRDETAFTDVVTTPVIAGLAKAILKPIRNELRLEKVMGKHQYDLFKEKQLQKVNYNVTHNQNHILGLTFSWFFWSPIETTRAFDLRTGKLITLLDLFREGQLDALANVVDHRLRTEIAEMIRDYKGSRDIEYAIKSENILKVTSGDLKDLSIDEKGITLFYHAGFHHTSSWAEPKGRYFFTYSELTSYLKPQSPVSQFLN